MHVDSELKDFSHSLALCAANRVVQSEPLSSRIATLFDQPLLDEGRKFYYTAMVKSPFLDDNVRSERTGFTIQEYYDGPLASTEISLDDIKQTAAKHAEKHLEEFLSQHKEIRETRVRDFVDRKAPRYKPVIQRFFERGMEFSPNNSDKELELQLHKELVQVEEEIISEGHDLLSQINSERPDFETRLNDYLKKVCDTKMSDLASYVSKRKVVIELFEESLRRLKTGDYNKENVIHNLIMPMHKTSEEIQESQNNLWLINEELSFHHYLASDKPLTSIDITDSKDIERPDILSLHLYDTPIMLSTGQNVEGSITVIEFKRPLRKDIGNAVRQATGYIKKIRRGECYTLHGRPIKNVNNIPGFVYVICDMTSEIEETCQEFQLDARQDGQGYFGYMRNPHNCYIEVMSFDAVLESAKKRNRAFFDQLGLPCT